MSVPDYKINYKSDFVLTINGDAGWAVPFCIKFWTGMPSQAYFVGFDGVKYVNCRVGDTPTQLLVMFDDHHMPIGKLKMQIAYHTTIEEFPGSVFDEVTNARDVIVTIDGTDYQVMLDFTGEDAPELEFNLPAYANEAERIQNELQRQQNEAARIEAELQREQATAAAVQGAENVNAQLNGTTLTVTNRNGVSTSVNTKGEQGEQGPVGPEGPQGETGISIVSFLPKSETATTLIYTITYSNGYTQDVAIPKGPQGDTGLTGNGISSTTLNSDYTLTVNYTDGTSYTTPSIRGAQGVQGVSIIAFTQTGETSTNTLYNVVFSDGRTQSVAIPKGVKGDKGDTGNTGSQGAQGPKGDTVTATDYTLYNVQGSSSEGAMSQDATTKAISAQTGYYTCETAAGTAAKVVTVESGNLYKRTLGGHFKVKMTNANTAASGVTLQVGSEMATALWYNGAAVSAQNTWEADEIISVFYDGTRFMASNSQGGGGKLKVDENNTADFSISDTHGSEIVEFKDGHIRTKYFDSRDSKTKVGNNNAVDLSICDENDNDIVEFKGGHIRTKYFNSQDLIIDKTYSYKGEKISLGENYLTVQEMMSTTHTIPRHLQGCAVYGKYLFVADDYLNGIGVYDLENKVLVNAVSFTPNPNYHCNNVNFGTYKYANTDATPCMYISQEKEDTHLILVFQVTFSNDVFGFNLVQTITMPTPQAGVSPYYPNSMIDADNGILYVMGYSTNSYTESDSNKIIVLKYELPLPTDGDVALQATDIYAKFPSITATQGGCIYKGKFYQAFGGDSTGSVVIRSSDMQNFCNRLYLADYGVTTEPEAACIYDDSLLVIGINKKVYKFKF